MSWEEAKQRAKGKPEFAAKYNKKTQKITRKIEKPNIFI